ncbi:MAG TPA: type II secretion system protein [Candidatus Competibacter sp.]|jgi:general secretion pathway protein I|nr:type II secretion system protein [Candidatus Competibacter sp.]MCC9003824.1 type II secretion system GspH family protein [Candidatus Competibacter sp.]HRX60848.1 type II secretion system protein [Candidatus Competibacter sp.]HUM90293.1 type II secretion system protein [Candidatus Competibacter sp.]
MEHRRQEGFSLLEVLVAFVILSISLGVLLQVFATGLRNAGTADDYTQATLYAESILAAIGRETPLSEGQHSGPINDRFSWRSTVAPYTDDMPDPEKTHVRAYRVEVEVFWDGLAQTRSVMLETLRLTPVESPAG